MIRDWYAMGYSYTELQPWEPKYSPGGKYDRSLYIQDLRQKMTNLYSSTRNLWLQHGRNIGSGTDQYDEDYVINIIYDKYVNNLPTLYFTAEIMIRFELGGSPYTIHVYLGKDKVGSVYNFSSRFPEDGDGSCGNCNKQREAKQLFTGQVPITSALIKAVRNPDIHDLQAIKKEDVRTWLTKQLNWRVTVASSPSCVPHLLPRLLTLIHHHLTYMPLIDAPFLQKGHEVPLTEMENLKVALAAGKAHHYEEDDRMSRYYGYEYLFGITEDKERGATHADSDYFATTSTA